MHDIPASPPIIHPLPPGEVRPLWSVMIPVYNCSQFLPETIKSVLKQGFPAEQMQIEVVDDASTDADVAAMVKRLGQGRVQYYRQPQNVGSLRNFETCINRSRGKLVHLLHGDDYVLDGFYKKLGNLLKQYPEAGAAFCCYRYMDESGRKLFDQTVEMAQDGILQDWLLRIGERQLAQYAAMVVRRDVYEKLGSFYGVDYGEDWEMWVRIAREYPVAYTPEVLASYRKHASSISGQKFSSGQHLRDLLYVMGVIQQHLPEENKKKLLKKSKRFYAHYGTRIANQIWHSTHNKTHVREQVRQILTLDRSLSLYWKVSLLYLKMMINRR